MTDMPIKVRAEKREGEEISTDEQLARWVAGDPVHNASRGECCPDFSCCQPQLLASLDVRQRFKRACDEGDEQAKMAMLGGFLATACASATADTGIEVYVSGDGTQLAD